MYYDYLLLSLSLPPSVLLPLTRNYLDQRFPDLLPQQVVLNQPLNLKCIINE